VQGKRAETRLRSRAAVGSTLRRKGHERGIDREVFFNQFSTNPEHSGSVGMAGNCRIYRPLSGWLRRLVSLPGCGHFFFWSQVVFMFGPPPPTCLPRHTNFFSLFSNKNPGWLSWDGGELPHIPALKWVVEKTRSLPDCGYLFLFSFLPFCQEDSPNGTLSVLTFRWFWFAPG
jgi:hypothetical protein